MKKAVAYTATAILLGFAVMMIPLALQTGPPTYRPQLTPMAFNAPAESRNPMGDVTSKYGLASKPLNLIPSILILLLGLIVAVGVYVFLKKRIV